MTNISYIDQENLEKTRQTADLLAQDFKELMKVKDPNIIAEVTKLNEMSKELKQKLDDLSDQLST